MDELLDTAPCGFFSFADDGAVELINTTLLQTLGYHREEVVGRHVAQLLTSGTRIFYQTHWLPLLRLHGRVAEVSLTFCKESGEEVRMLSYARRRHADGLYDCVVVEAHEGRSSEDELNRAKSSFLAVMSHELRTPLNAIGGYLQILELGIAGPVTEQQHEILKRLDRSSRHLQALINDVLDLSRIEAGKIEYDISDVALADVVGGATPMIEPQLAEKDIELTVDVPRRLVARADPDKLRQIILNLLSNAAKFTPRGGRIEFFATTSDDGSVELHVRDTGIGIPADQLETIFRPFVQVDSGHTRAAEGSGLGLAISRDLARGMGGDVTVTSEPGKGSTFTCRIPARGYSPERFAARGTARGRG